MLLFIKLAGDHLSKIDLQKLIFLFQQKSRKIFYDFIPYHYGCYSFQANEDMHILQRQGWISIKDKQIELINKHPKIIDCYTDVKRFLSTHNNVRGNDLIKIVYISYPYYAIKSKIAQRLLTKDELQKIENVRQTSIHKSKTLFTIGYEGITIEAYINKLIQNDIRLICDVRNNPISRKFGFSKTILSSILQEINIEYVHMPELGIVSKKRKELKDQTDYETLFDEYKKTLSKKKVYIKKVFDLLCDKKRIALTCFEKDPKLCHRHILSQFIKDNYIAKIVNL
jgi:uncharacterized protein (DUF488 family)